MTVPFPQPTTPAGSRTEVFLRYLDFFRDPAGVVGWGNGTVMAAR